MKGTQISSKFPADQMIERIKAAAVDQEIERGDQPHQRIFHAELVPEITTDPPALEIGHIRNNTSGTAAPRVNRPSASIGPAINSVAEISGAQNQPGR